jgi:hypothetical protein
MAVNHGIKKLELKINFQKMFCLKFVVEKSQLKSDHINRILITTTNLFYLSFNGSNLELWKSDHINRMIRAGGPWRSEKGMFRELRPPRAGSDCWK